jgi:hypothetical protein
VPISHETILFVLAALWRSYGLFASVVVSFHDQHVFDPTGETGYIFVPMVAIWSSTPSMVRAFSFDVSYMDRVIYVD